MVINMIEGIGIELKGKHVKQGTMSTYHMTDEEINLEKQGKIAVVGTTTYVMSPGCSYKEHKYSILNMNIVKKVDIHYDTEDEMMMSQTFTLKNGETIFSRSRNHDEVKRWKENGVQIDESYGY